MLGIHFGNVVRERLAQILGKAEVDALLGQHSPQQPDLVAQVLRDPAKTAALTWVLQSLLADDVPIRNMPTILDAFVRMEADATKERALAIIRGALSRDIAARIQQGGTVRAIVFFDDLCDEVAWAQAYPNDHETERGERFANTIFSVLERAVDEDAYLFVPPSIQDFVNDLYRISSARKGPIVLGLHELAGDLEPESVIGRATADGSVETPM